MNRTDWILLAITLFMVFIGIESGYSLGQWSMRQQVINLSLDLEQQRRIDSVLKYQLDVDDSIIMNGKFQ